MKNTLFSTMTIDPQVGKKGVTKTRTADSKPSVSSVGSIGSKKILHPIFIECAEFTLDPYWQHVFEDCARGKLPRGSVIDATGRVVHFRCKSSDSRNFISYKLTGSPEKILQDLKKLFQEHLNLKSRKDRLDIGAELDIICEELQSSYSDTWKNIKRKKIKDPIIRRYILDIKEQHNLTSKETAEVAQIIRLGFLFNWISNENVIYQDRRILDIINLRFDPEERTFEIEEPVVVGRREYKPKISRLSTLWHKHLKEPKNRYHI